MSRATPASSAPAASWWCSSTTTCRCVRGGWLRCCSPRASTPPGGEFSPGPTPARLEGSPPHSCGREGAPITTLDLGPEDTPARYAWGANMAIRRRALERVGPFDTSLEHGGDEQEWQGRTAGGG